MSSKYAIGIRVEFLNSRYDTEEFRYYDYNLKYTEGQSGFVINVSDEPSLDENTGLEEYKYTIQVGMGSVINVPESDLINPNSTLQEKVEQRLRKKQENKEFKDTEGRIGGSKKEKRAYSIIKMSDLKNIEQDEATAIELIKKDKVFPQININLEIENGVSSGAAFLKVKLREVFPPVPINIKRRDAYVGLANFFITNFNSINTYEQFLIFIKSFYSDIPKIILEILDSDLYEIVMNEKEVSKEALAELDIQQKELYELYESEEKKIVEKYGIDTSNYNWINEYNLDESDKFILNDLKYKITLNREGINHYSKKYSQPEILFYETLTGEKSTWDIDRNIIVSILGKKFLKFIKGKDPFDKAYQLAFDYESFSDIESQIAIDKESEYSLSTIDKHKNDLKELSKIYELDSLINFFKEKSYYGYSGGDFGKKPFYSKDIQNIVQAEAYRQRWIKTINTRISELEAHIEKIKHKFRVRENNWEWFTDAKIKPKNTTKAELVINTLPPLAYIKRVGGYLVSDSDVTPQSIKDKFGFKEVEFGQSLKDEDAKEHVKHFLGGMADLGDILDIDIIKLNKIGGLSIAFASRGSGKALAHYDGLRKIINLTKLRGGGALAHEYLHYIDNAIPKINREDYTYKDYASVEPSKNKYYSRRKVADQEVAASIRYIFDYINKKIMPLNFSKKSNGDTFVFKTIYKSENRYGIPRPYENETIEEYLQRFFRFYPKYEVLKYLTPKTKAILGYILNTFNLEKYTFKLKSDTSMFYANSVAMKSPYWKRELELFARGFETYIFDKLEKAGRSNNYLVSGGYFDREEGVYPYGDERADLFVLYDNFIETIKHEYKLEGFKSWTTERVDEYITINDKGDEDTGVIVDDETGELIEKIGEYTPIQKKLIKLAELLEKKSRNNKKKK